MFDLYEIGSLILASTVWVDAYVLLGNFSGDLAPSTISDSAPQLVFAILISLGCQLAQH